MLKLIKKDGRKVSFVLEKINVSIANTANDINFMLNKKDIELIAKDVEAKIIKLRGIEGTTTSYEVISLVLESLHAMGFIKVADTYYRGSFGKLGAK